MRGDPAPSHFDCGQPIDRIGHAPVQSLSGKRRQSVLRLKSSDPRLSFLGRYERFRRRGWSTPRTACSERTTPSGRIHRWRVREQFSFDPEAVVVGVRVRSVQSAMRVAIASPWSDCTKCPVARQAVLLRTALLGLALGEVAKINEAAHLRRRADRTTPGGPRTAVCDTHPVRIRVLGPVSLVDDNGSTSPVPGTGAAALAVLIVRPVGGIESDQLAAQLWGHDHHHQSGSLRTVISRLRARLEMAGLADAIATEGGRYKLIASPELIDATHARRLDEEAASALQESVERSLACAREGLSMFAGRPFEGCEDTPILTAEAADLDDVRLRLEEAEVRALIGLGSYAAAAAAAVPLSHDEPLRERRWALRMVAEYHDQRPADALRSFELARRTLRDEVGLEPGGTLRALESAILRDDADAVVLEAGTGRAQAPLLARRLPAAPSSSDLLVGRDETLAAVVTALENSRHVTVLGAPGVGKTRLAHEVADNHLGPVAYFAPEGDADDQALSQIGVDLGVRGTTEELPQRIAAYLARFDNLLLVMDGVEHVRRAATDLVDAVMTHGGTVRVLVTSRVALSTESEVGLRLEPLSEEDALAFLQARVEPQLMGAFDRIDLERLVASADRLPVTMQLIARALRWATPSEIAEEISSRGHVTSAATVGDGRNPRSTVGWSYQLLEIDEQVMFDSLAPMRGRFALEDACQQSGYTQQQATRSLRTLVEHSLIEADTTGKVASYRWLDSIRQVAIENAQRSGSWEELTRRHRVHFCEVAVRGADLIRGRDESSAMQRLIGIEDQVRAAWSSALDARDVDTALSLSHAVWHFGVHRLRFDLINCCETALALHGADTHDLYRAVVGGAAMARWIYSDYHGCARLVDVALQHRSAAGPEPVLAWNAHMNLSGVTGDEDAGGEGFRRVRTWALDNDDHWMLTNAYASRALGQALAGRQQQASEAAHAAMDAADVSGSGSAAALALYATAAAELLDQPVAALGHARDSIQLARSVSNGWVELLATSLAATAGRLAGRLDTSAEALAGALVRWHDAKMWSQLARDLAETRLLLEQAGRSDLAVQATALAGTHRAGFPAWDGDSGESGQLEAGIRGPLSVPELAAALSDLF